MLCVDRKDSIKWYSADQEAYAIYFAPFDSRRLRSKRSGFTQRFKVWSKSPDLFYKYSIWKDGCPEEDILDPHIRVGDPEGDPTSGPLRPVPPAPPVPDPEVDPGP